MSDHIKEYVVESILDIRNVNGTNEYLVKWEGWAESNNSWEPVINLSECIELLTAYESKNTPPLIIGTEQVTSGEHLMQLSGIHNSWPTTKIPHHMLGVKAVSSGMVYVICTNETANCAHPRERVIFVRAAGFRDLFPQIIIDYYETKIKWHQ